MPRNLPLRLLLAFSFAPIAVSQTSPKEAREFLPEPFDHYFQQRVAELSDPEWQNDITNENWPAKQTRMRKQLQGMLGLDPWPERNDLKPVIVGTLEGDGYIVEKLHFQSRPGLYVAANLYRPREVTKPLPTVLYVCGHSEVIENGVRMGNKTAYQQHGIWFARNGYVCLVIDTIQRGEFPGEHWGTYNQGRWWWAARGYTPAGVEAWNGLRALDYLETRSEVDRTRFGITGISGGGVYSWWIAALDDRIKVAAPTAGITTLGNHILDGAIEGHCDCMYMVNTERWNFDRVAALVAPRPLLILNSDKDTIFPLDGVMEIYHRTRSLYRKLGKEPQVGLHIAEGPHEDTQPLHIGAFQWMNRFLKGAGRTELIDEPARKAHSPRALKVFSEPPTDEKVTTIDESFVPAFSPSTAPPTVSEWSQQRDSWMKALQRDCFRAWPAEPIKAQAVKPSVTIAEGLRLTITQFASEKPFQPMLWLLHRDDTPAEDLDLVVLNVLDEEGWNEFRRLAAAGFQAQFAGAEPDRQSFAEARQMLLGKKWGMAYVAPRGVGSMGWSQLSARKQTQLRRRLLLLGESLESGQVFDIRQAASALRNLPGLAKTPLRLKAGRTMAANTLYASLFIPDVQRLDLHEVPLSHREGPTYLNILRHLDLPQAVALAAERADVVLYTDNPEPWSYPQAVAQNLNWGEKRLQIRPAAAE